MGMGACFALLPTVCVPRGLHSEARPSDHGLEREVGDMKQKRGEKSWRAECISQPSLGGRGDQGHF